MATTEKLPVLVTGGAGYIGSHAVLALVDAGWPVVVLDTLATGYREAISPDAEFVQGDVADADLVGEVIARHRIGAIIHFAGSLLVAESVTDPLKYYRNNTSASRTLIETALHGGVRHFLFSSSAATYGVPESVPIPETAAQRPINPYGMSKLMTELMLRDVSAVHPINHIALRYFNVAGADPDGRAGQSSDPATHLIHVASEVAAGKRDAVHVFGTDYPTPDGSAVRDYVHVSDLADAHVLALEALIAAPERSRQLNVGYGRGFSVIEVLDAVDRLLQRKLPRVLAGRRAGDPDQLVADSGVLKAELGWSPRFDDLDAIVADALRWTANPRYGKG